MESEFINEVAHQIQTITKTKDSDNLDEIREHLLFNIRLTRLSTKVFPDEIREALSQFFKSYSPTSFNHREFMNLKNNLSSI